MVEYDTILKHFLSYDNVILGIQNKFLLEYLNCKIKTCYDNSSNTHLNYEKCKRKCGEKMIFFEEFKRIIYHDFNAFYFKKFSECNKQEEEKNYNLCIESTKKLMESNIFEIKKLFNNKSKKLL